MSKKTEPRLRIGQALAVSVATLVGVAPLAFGEESSQRALTATTVVEEAASGGRYEGYRFVDVEGRPLPFQADEAIEENLLAATAVEISKIPVGVTRPRKVVLEVGAVRFHAAFKFVEEKMKNVRDRTATGGGRFYLEWRDSYIYDLAAYHVDRLLGLDRTPPVVLREIKGDPGSLQIWVEGTITEAERRERAIDPPEVARFNQQWSTHQIFDNLVANRDSNLGNTLIDGNWRLWFIDCSRCFGQVSALLYPDTITHCDREVWRALKELDREEAERELTPYLTGIEIDALFKRRDQIVELIQGRIDEWGEELVLFDQRPPTERASWAVDE